MRFKLLFTKQASHDYDKIGKNKSQLKQFKAIRKALGYLETNPRHPGLNTHKYTSITGPSNEEVFETYAENKTPAAYRIFWHYGPQKKQITILAITPHP
jgi:hypothetical protein